MTTTAWTDVVEHFPVIAGLTLDRISKTFSHRVAAVCELSLRVELGELMVLVGPSGCGKTTTLRLTAGLEQPDAGQITIGDRIVNDLPPAKRDVAMVFQDSALYPHMTVRKNLVFPLRMRKIAGDEIERRVREAAALCGIGDLLDRKPAALSGGELQRAALARAVVRRPAVMLLDEPLSNLDAPLRSRLRAQIRQLQRRLNITTLHVTHDQEEAMALGDRVAVMARGALQQVGTPMEVYRFPANRFVAGFFGQPAMNFIPGRIVRQGSAMVFIDDGEDRFTLPGQVAPRLQSMSENKAMLGVRPHDLRIAPPALAVPGGQLLRAEQVLIEPLGDLCDVRCRTAQGVDITARLPHVEAATLKDRLVTFQVDPASLHLFEDGDFGRNLLVHSDK